MADRELIGLAGLGVLFVLLFLRMPVGLAMVAVGIGGNFALSQAESFLRFEPFLRQFKTLLWGLFSNYDLSVIPLFLFMGFLAGRGRLSTHLFQGINALVGHVRGGVAMAAVGACAGFGAVCGSSLATASTMGRVALPELARLNYAPRLATGTLAAGGTLGILIPPSVALVIYAIIVEASVIAMFQAAILPGIIAVGFFIGTIAFLTRLRPELAPNRASLAPDDRRRALRRLAPVLGIFGLIILGLGLGLFTPTPAAAVGATLILVYGIVLRLRSPDEGLAPAGIRASILDTSVTTGMIFFILFGAEVLKSFFARAGLPAALTEWTAAAGIDPWAVLILMLVVLILLGCVLDSLAMILVMVPFFWPVLVVLNGGDFVSAEAATFGMTTPDLKLWFGILALIVVELGLITPPVGLNVFIIASLSPGTRMSEVFAGVLPFLAVEILRIGLILAAPGLCLVLPRLLS